MSEQQTADQVVYVFEMVGAEGFEPSTTEFQTPYADRCATPRETEMVQGRGYRVAT